jgi:ABC-type Fe3+/spermidine/putrescine transport system ATPase subunit
MSAPGLELAGISLRLGSFALKDVSFAVAPDEILVLLGANGAGKSVCLETVAGFHRPSSGRILVSGRDITEHRPEKRHVAFLLQDFALFPHLSIAENVAVGGGAARDAAALNAMLSRFGVAHLANSYPEYLSPGEKQRAALARALASRPSLYLFDEPFAALDAATAERLRDELRSFMRRTGVPSVFVTHDRAEAQALADRVAVIEHGAIHQCGPAAEVFARPGSTAIARLLGMENIVEGLVIAESADLLRVSLGDTTIDVAKRAAQPVLPRQVTLCIRAENVHLVPPQPEAQPNRLRARIVELRRSGPLWKVSLDCGFPLIAYALPQTVRAAALAAGGPVDAEIDPCAIHVLAAAPA